jgi:hypothetical protein
MLCGVSLLLPIPCVVLKILQNQPTFSAGRLSRYLPEWQKITSDHIILQYVKGVKIEFTNHTPPPANAFAEGSCRWQQATLNKCVAQTEIQKLLDKGVLVVSQHEVGEFISPIFLLPKKDGSHRMILNLKSFNQYVEYHHFKMETLEAAIKLMKPGCYMASIDLKDAYYTVAIHTEHQKYLKFEFNGILYQYTCLPNGLASAPRIFTKLLKPVYSTLRSMGHLNSGYIDDSYLQGDSVEECNTNITATASLMNTVGFFLHPDKSVLSPTQNLVFLGFLLNSINMTVSPTPEKITKIINCCTELLQSSLLTIRQVSQVLGTLVSTLPGVEYGQLHFRFLEMDKIRALQENNGNFEAHLTLSAKAVLDLKWWIQNIPVATKSIIRATPSYVIMSDASKLGWGAVIQTEKTGGRWTVAESSSHINYLELLAAYFALKSFCFKLTHCHVQLQLDNTTAVTYINKMGGTRSIELNELTKTMWEWCIEHSIWISGPHCWEIKHI